MSTAMTKTGELRETLLIEGAVAEGTRLEVELWVRGETAASAARGDTLTVLTAEGVVSVDVSSLSLRSEDAHVEKGSWEQLRDREEAALVADRSPAPHVRAELHVRRIGPGDAVRIEGRVTGHTFDDARAPRGSAVKRVRSIRAVRLNPPRPRLPKARPSRGPSVARWFPWIPWIISGGAIAASVYATSSAGSTRVGLNTAALAVSSLVAARFLSRALSLPPAMDRGMAEMLIRMFARAARSLPRFDPEANDGARRWATYFGPVAVLGWVYVVFLSVFVWPGVFLFGEVDPARFDPRGAAELLGGVALALGLLAIGYLVADWGEVARTRALLEALRGRGDWRAVLGTVRAGGSEALFRTVRVESDSLANSESVDFWATHESGGTSFRLETPEGTFAVPTRGLDWASDDWKTQGLTTRLRVRDGATAIVAGFFDGDSLVQRGPHSVLLFASLSGRPTATLYLALVRRWVDALSAGGAAAVVGVIAADLWMT